MIAASLRLIGLLWGTLFFFFFFCMDSRLVKSVLVRINCISGFSSSTGPLIDTKGVALRFLIPFINLLRLYWFLPPPHPLLPLGRSFKNLIRSKNLEISDVFEASVLRNSANLPCHQNMMKSASRPQPPPPQPRCSHTWMHYEWWLKDIQNLVLGGSSYPPTAGLRRNHLLCSRVQNRGPHYGKTTNLRADAEWKTSARLSRASCGLPQWDVQHVTPRLQRPRLLIHICKEFSGMLCLWTTSSRLKIYT